MKGMNSEEINGMMREMMVGKSKKRGAPGEKKMHKVMHEFKSGTLKSSSGEKVKKRKQAIAIGMSEARRAQHKHKA